MQIQPVDNNTNFGAITSIKTKGKDFKKAPAMAGRIVNKVINNEKCQSVYEPASKVIIRAIDFQNFTTQMIYGKEMPYNNAIRISIYKNSEGNIFLKTLKNVRGFFAKNFTAKGKYSKGCRDIAPYEIYGYGNTFQRAYYDAIHLLDIGAKPSQNFRRLWYF